MKNITIIALLGLSMVISVALLGACNDDGAPGCSTICGQIADCPDTDSDNTVDEQINECLEMCNNMKAVLQSDVYDSMATCADDNMCSDTNIEETCFANAMSHCSSSDASDAFLTVLCDKMVECGAEGMTDMDTCLASMNANPTVHCMKTSVYEQTSACINNSTCDTAENCLSDLIFMDDSSSGSDNNDI